MKEQIEAFLADLDCTLATSAQGNTLEIYHLGRSALVWHYAYSATTQDFDFIRPEGAADLLATALRLFGPEAPKALEHGIYLQVVDDGLPPMPWGYKQRATEIAGSWTVLRVFRLDPYDLVASKLRRFWPKDRADVRLLCDLVELEPERLEQILEEAFPFNMEKDGDEFRDRAFRSLRIVQRYLRHEIDSF